MNFKRLQMDVTDIFQSARFHFQLTANVGSSLAAFIVCGHLQLVTHS